MKKNQKGSAGIVILLIVTIAGLIGSGVVDNTKLKEGKIQIDKKVVDARQPVDYTKLNN